MPLLKYAHVIVGVIFISMFGISSARADKQVYKCTALSTVRDCDDEYGPPNLANYTPIADPKVELSTAELKLKASRCAPNGDPEEGVTMYRAMFKNKYPGIAFAVAKLTDGIDIYIVKGWHKGGWSPKDRSSCHFTVRVRYKDEWRGTCHVYGISDGVYYGAFCQNRPGAIGRTFLPPP